MSDAQSTHDDGTNYPDAIHVGTYKEPTLATGDEDTDAGEAMLPLRGDQSVLTSRAFLTGKSGAGKSNTANVVIEEILRAGRPLAIIDTEGEYFGLKEEFEMLHVGGDTEVDVQVGPEHGEKLAELALERSVPLIIDVSGYIDEDTADELLLNFVRALFAKAKKLKRPFPLFVEEAHEYLPESGGSSDLEELFITLGKRGRKHGLGVIAISQRPADVRKAFITQCNWVVWHRLTWDNDTNVVGRIVGSDYKRSVTDLENGEAFLSADWEDDSRRVKFRRQDTYDGGATPTLADEDATEVPDLKTVGDELAGELEAVSDRHQSLEDENESLREKLDDREETIDALREQLETRDYVTEEVEERFEATAETFADAVEAAMSPGKLSEAEVAEGGEGGVEVQLPDELRAEVMEVVESDLGERVADLEASLEAKETELRDARSRVEELEATLETRNARLEELEAEKEELADRVEDKERVEAKLDEIREIRDRLTSILGEPDADTQDLRDRAGKERDRAEEAEDRVADLEAVLSGEKPPEEVGLEAEALAVPGDQPGVGGVQPGEYVATVEGRPDALQTLVDEAVATTALSSTHFWAVLHELAEVADGTHPEWDQTGENRPTRDGIEDRVEVGSTSVSEILNALAEPIALVEIDQTGHREKNRYTLNMETFEDLDARAAYYKRREQTKTDG